MGAELQPFAVVIRTGQVPGEGLHGTRPSRMAGSAVVFIRLGALLLSALAVCAMASLVRVIPYGRAIKDYLFILDGSYRIGLGQVPHVDFSSPIGPLTLYLTWLAGRLFPAGQPFVGLHALMWIAFLPPLACLAPRGQSGARFGAAVGLLALVVLVPFTLDSTHLSEISYFAIYNRFASGGLFLVALWYVLPKQRWDAVLLAYLISLLFFLKITAAVTACGLLFAAMFLRRTSLLTVAGALVAAVGLCSLVEAKTGLVSAYLRDIIEMSAINAAGLSYRLLAAAAQNWTPLAAAALIAGLAAWDMRCARALSFARPGAALARLVRDEPFVIDVLLLIGMALMADSQNTGGIGLVAAAAVLFRNDVAAQQPARFAAAVLLGASLVLPLISLAVDRSVTALVRERAGTTEHAFSTLLPGMRVPTPTLEGARLFRQILHSWLPLADEIQNRHFNLVNDPTDNAPAALAAWAEDVTDAAAVFRAEGLAASAKRYATLAFADPFARLLGLTPARGVSLVMDVHRTVGLFDPQEASRYLSDADGVFVARCELTNGETTSRVVFDAVLAAEFERHRLNACWDFYRRKAASYLNVSASYDPRWPDLGHP